MYQIYHHAQRKDHCLIISTFLIIFAACFCQVNACHSTSLNILNGTWCEGGKPTYGPTLTPFPTKSTAEPPTTTDRQPGTPPRTFNCFCGALQEETLFTPKNGKRMGDEINRPWIVHFNVSHQNDEPYECGGALLNKRWILTSAKCIPNHRGKSTKDPDVMSAIQKEVSVIFGTKGYKPKLKIIELVIHPEYEFLDEQVNLALVKMDKEIFNDEMTDYKNGKIVQPICLSHHFNLIEDIDCVVNGEYDTLKCNHDEKEKGAVISKTHITAWGNLGKQTETSKNTNYKCYTNSFGPRYDLFHQCTGTCFKEIINDYIVTLPNTKPREGNWANPSMAHPVCDDFIQTSLSDAKERQKKITDEKLVPLADTNYLGYVVIQTKDYSPNGVMNISCYPHQPWGPETQNAASMSDNPFSGGWCVTGTVGPPLNHPMTEKGWGFCLPQCTVNVENPRIERYHTRVKESVVDSFFRDDCQLNVGDKPIVHKDLEFCTGFPTVHSYAQYWTHEGGKKFTFKDHIYRGVLSQAERTEGKYKVPVITPTIGDTCLGDTGGTVWKMKHINGSAYAYITGIVSKDEKNCGNMNLDTPNYKPRFAVHARVMKLVKWIQQNSIDGQCKHQQN